MKFLEIELQPRSIIVIAIILILISFGIGFGLGVREGIGWSVAVASKFVDFKIDTNMLATAVYQYKNNIGGCLFAANATGLG